ncbi:MAG TPA: HAD-IA family hydrolase [Sulfuricella sp.]|nr:HAD-IA family hydrolase [Sulfuricella sp.]
MPKQFDLLVFDWDGTLMDSAGAISYSIQAASRDMGLSVPGENEARHIIGLGLNEAIAALFPDLPRSDYGALVDRYRHHYLSRDMEIPLFGGVAETIAALHEEGFLLAVATGKGRRGLDSVLECTGLGKYFHSSRCADECFSKPHPCMLLELMAEFGVSPAKTLMIGDTSHDLLMADNAGVSAIGVCYGAHPRDSLKALSPLVCVENFGELSRWLSAHA